MALNQHSVCTSHVWWGQAQAPYAGPLPLLSWVLSLEVEVDRCGASCTGLPCTGGGVGGEGVCWAAWMH